MGGAIAGVVTQALGNQFSAYGQFLAGKATAKALRADREQLRIEQSNNETVAYQAEARVRAENVVATAKSGVLLQGSPMEVLAYNTFQAERDRFISRRATQLKIDTLTLQADMARVQAGLSATATGFGGSGGGAGSFLPNKETTGGGPGRAAIQIGSFQRADASRFAVPKFSSSFKPIIDRGT